MPTHATADLLAPLNPSQREAVEHWDSPLLIVAGAGTGKTLVMARRMAYGHLTGRSPLARTLALTFTEKATREMQERLDALLPYGTSDRWVHTFHAFCERVLRRYGTEIGLSPQFTRLTETDFIAFIRARLPRLGLTRYAPKGSPTHTVQAIAHHISRLRDEGRTAQDYLAYAQGVEDTDEREGALELARAYAAVEEMLMEEHCVDFGGLLLWVWRLLNERPAVCAALQTQFSEVLVDEFQDTNWVQYAIVKTLVAPHGRVSVVGDDDQAIYAFRGASVQNILSFQEDFPQSKVIVLEENYRSRQGILTVATDFIRLNNPHRLEAVLTERYGRGKNLKSQTTEDATLAHWRFATGQEEASGVVEECVRLHDEEGYAWQDMAILARGNDHLLPFADQCRARGIPYGLPGEQGLYKTDSVLDTLALLRWIVGGADSSLHVFRLLTHPTLGLADADVLLCNREAKATGRTLDALIAEPPAALSVEGKRRAQEWHECVEALRGASRRQKAFELFLFAIEKSGILGTIIAQEEPARTRQFQALRACADRLEALERIAPYGSLREVVDALDAEQELGDEGEVEQSEAGPDEIRLLTIHKSKGLEFRAVFVVNLVNQRMPASRRSSPLPIPLPLVRMPAQGDDPHTEEERRLFYVALTRAKERLTLTWAVSYGGARGKNASPFLLACSIPETDKASMSQVQVLALPSPYRGTLRSPRAEPLSALSFSQIRAFDSCPLQYQFTHVWHVPTVKGKASMVGNITHKIVEVLFAEWRESEAPPSPERMERALGEYWQALGEGSAVEQSQERARVAGAVRWAVQEAQAQGTRVHGVEVPFLSDMDGIALRGKIDRVDMLADGVAIVDYKTGRAKTEEELTFDDKLQLLLYQIIAPQIFGVPVIRLSLWYVMEERVVSFLGTEKELEKAKKYVSEAAAQIRQGVFAATPNARTCASCDYRHICPLRAL